MVPSCAEGGVLGVLPGMIAMIQGTEAIKLITGTGTPLIGRLMLYNALDMHFRELKLRRDPNCPVCGENPTVTELIDYEQFCGIGKHNDEPDGIIEIGPMEFKIKRENGDDFKLLDVRESQEYEICHLEDSTLIPLGELPNRWEEIKDWQNQEVVVLCKIGARSRKAIEILEMFDFKNLKNFAGGINAYSREVDASVPLY